MNTLEISWFLIAQAFLLLTVWLLIAGFRRRRKFVYVRLVDAATGKPLQNVAVFAERNHILYLPGFATVRNGLSDYAYNAESSQSARLICHTDSKGEFRHKIRWKATYGFSVALPGTSNYGIIYADHVMNRGIYPRQPTILRVPSTGGILLPGTML